MATAEQCKHHGDCGFVAFRRTSSIAKPLPEDGDCGIPVDSCCRVLMLETDHKPIGIETLLRDSSPRFDTEIKVGLNYLS